MTVITTRIIVHPDGTAVAAERLPPGEHTVRIEILDQPSVQEATEPFDMSFSSAVDIGPWPWPDGTTVSRDEIHGDDGR